MKAVEMCCVVLRGWKSANQLHETKAQHWNMMTYLDEIWYGERDEPLLIEHDFLLAIGLAL